MGRALARVALVLVVALVATTGCGADGDDAVPTGTKVTTTSGAVETPTTRGGSVLDVLDQEDLADHPVNELPLLELVTAPVVFDDGLRVATVQVDDPNRNGRVDGRWYPPRVVVDECQIKTDQAPMPTASASYIPGDPDDGPLGQLAAADAMLDAPYSIGVTVQLFDTAEQRDGMAATMKEFFETVKGGDLDCGLDGLFGDVQWVEPVDVGHPAFGVRSEPLISKTTSYLYSIGTRILLTVGQSLGPIAQDDAGKGPADGLLERTVRAEVALLEAAALPGS
jgi:hypothetical protein